MEQELQGSIAPTPSRHWLYGVGSFVAFACAAALAFTFLIPTEMPRMTSDVSQMVDTDAMQTATRNIILAAWARLIAEMGIGAGFFMWLAGAIIDAIRHPEHY